MSCSSLARFRCRVPYWFTLSMLAVFGVIYTASAQRSILSEYDINQHSSLNNPMQSEASTVLAGVLPNVLSPNINRYSGTNPIPSDIRAKLIAAGQKWRIPPQILFGIAYQESTWRQYGSDGYTLVSSDGGIGIMQLTGATASQFDVDRLAYDIDYNIDAGAQVLIQKWNATPVIGDGNGGNGHEKLENWFYSIWAYNGFVCGNSYPYTILNWIANCPSYLAGMWDNTSVTPPPSSAIGCPPGTIANTPSPVHIDANYDGVIDGSQNSTGAMPVPLIGQRLDPWQYHLLGFSSSDTIGNYGCAITSTAMVLNYYGANTDPDDLNNWLKGNGGYQNQDLIVWSVAAHHGNNTQFANYYNWTNVAANLSIVNSELASGYPVIAETRLNGIQHFVVITGNAGSGNYYINDPWFNDNNTRDFQK